MLAGVGEVLQRAGALPSAAPSKLARALGPIGPPLIAAPPEQLSPKAPIAEVVSAYAATHVRALQMQDRRLRQDLPDSVHKMRVSARRLRSTLRTFAPILDPAVVAALEPHVTALAATAVAASLADIGSIAYATDIAQMRHETLGTRIFRS